MLTVKPVDKIKNVSDDLKWTKNTHVTPFTLTFEGSMVVEPFFAPFFYPSTTVFTHPNDGWTGLCIKLWQSVTPCHLSN